MQNYINYFTEIEERFGQRRGSILLLSTLDWALIEAWCEAGIPLEAVLCGIDDAFNKYEARAQRAKGRLGRINGLAWAAQSVLLAAAAAAEAATGVHAPEGSGRPSTGLDAVSIAQYLERNAETVETSSFGEGISARLRDLATRVRSGEAVQWENLDRTLSVLEEKLYASVQALAPEAELVALREQADRELAPYRGKMQAVQIKQVQQQFLQKRLLEARGLPRLSLFYINHG